MSDDRDDEVGYGKPPKHTRFKPGQSGNPGGRKKGSRNFRTDLEEVLNAKVSIKENGKLKKVTSQQAALRRLTEKALVGEGRLITLFLGLAQQHSEEKEAQSVERAFTVSEDQILERFEDDIRRQLLEMPPQDRSGEDRADE